MHWYKATLLFLKESKERHKVFMTKIMNIESQSREVQKKFSLEALLVQSNIRETVHRRSGTSYETVGGNLETIDATAEIMIAQIEPGRPGDCVESRL